MKKYKLRIQYSISSIIPLILLLICFTGCAGQVDENKENSQIAEENPPPLPPPQKSIPPDRVILLAQVLNISELDTYFQCKIKVEKVLRYGSTVKPIGRGKELDLYLSKELDNALNILSEGTSKQKYEFTLEQKQSMNSISNQPGWKVLKINKIES